MPIEINLHLLRSVGNIVSYEAPMVHYYYYYYHHHHHYRQYTQYYHCTTVITYKCIPSFKY